jgi:hypothetical protein
LLAVSQWGYLAFARKPFSLPPRVVFGARSSQCVAILRRMASPPGEGSRMRQSAASPVHGGQDHDLRPHRSRSLRAVRTVRTAHHTSQPESGAVISTRVMTVSTVSVPLRWPSALSGSLACALIGLRATQGYRRRRAILGLLWRGSGGASSKGPAAACVPRVQGRCRLARRDRTRDRRPPTRSPGRSRASPLVERGQRNSDKLAQASPC